MSRLITRVLAFAGLMLLASWAQRSMTELSAHAAPPPATADDGPAVAFPSTKRYDEWFRGVTLRNTHLLPERLGHAATITHVAISPDGATVATGDEQGVVKLWRTAAGRVVRSFLSTCGAVTALEFSRDGRRLLITGLRRGAELRAVPSGALLQRVNGPSLPWLPYQTGFTTGALAPDGEEAVLGTGDSVLRWRFRDSHTSPLVTRSQSMLEQVVYAPDGRQIYALVRNLDGSERGGILEFDSRTGRRLRFLEVRPSGNGALAISWNGRFLACDDWATSGGGRIVVWDRRTGRKLQSLRSNAGWINSLAFAPDGRSLAAGYGEQWPGDLFVWRRSAGGPRFNLAFHVRPQAAVKALAVGSGIVFTGGEDRAVRLWDQTAGRQLRNWPGMEADTSALRFEGDGKILTWAQQRNVINPRDSAETCLSAWDVTTGHPTRAMMCADRAVLLPKGYVAVQRYREGTTLWDLPRRRAFWELDGNPSMPLDGSRIALGGISPGNSLSGEVRIYEVSSGSSTAVCSDELVHRVHYSPDGRTLAVVADGRTELRDGKTGALLTVIHGDSAVVAWSPDSTQVALLSGIRSLDLRDGRSGVLQKQVQADQPVSAATFSPDSDLLLIGEAGGKIQVWQRSYDRLIRTIAAHSSPIRAIAASSRLGIVASAGGDGLVKLWHPRSGLLLRTLRTTWSPKARTVQWASWRPQTAK